MSRLAIMAVLLAGLVLSAGGCAWSNNNAHRDPLGPDIDEVTGREMPPGYGVIR